MSTVDITKLTKAQLIELLRAAATSGDAPTAASAHWKARDITCNAPKACSRTFRTEKGRDWHVANVKHA